MLPAWSQVRLVVRLYCLSALAPRRDPRLFQGGPNLVGLLRLFRVYRNTCILPFFRTHHGSIKPFCTLLNFLLWHGWACPYPFALIVDPICPPESRSGCRLEQVGEGLTRY